MFRDDQGIQNYIGNSENTLNNAACRSAATMLLRLKELYPDAVTDRGYIECIAALRAHVEQDESKLQAISSLASHAEEPVDPDLDRITVYLPRVNERGETVYKDEQHVFELKAVIALVYAALNDSSKFEYSLALLTDGTLEEKRQKQLADRMSGLLQAIMDVQRGVCHLGIRHELVFLLNGAFSFDGVKPHYLIQDGILSIVLLIRDGIAKAYEEKKKAASDVEMKAVDDEMINWIVNGDLRGITRILNIDNSIRTTIERLFVESSINPWSQTVAEQISNLMQQTTFEYAVSYPEIFSEFKVLFEFPDHKNEKATEALSKIRGWAEIDCKINNAADLKRVRSFNKMYQLSIAVQRHHAYLMITESDLTTKFNRLCDVFFEEVVYRTPFPVEPTDELLTESKKIQDKLSAFKDGKINSVLLSNLLADWFVASAVSAAPAASRAETLNSDVLQNIYKLFLNEEILAKIYLDDGELQAIIQMDNSIDLDPYYINRIFLHAMLKPVSEWSNLFFTVFSQTLAFVKNSFNQPRNGLYAQLMVTSYPDVLLTQLTYLEQQRLGNATEYPAYNIVLPQHVKSMEDVINVFDWLSEDIVISVYLKFKPIFNAIIKQSIRRPGFQASLHASVLYRFACENPKVIAENTNDISSFIKMFHEYGTLSERNFLFLKLISCIQQGWFQSAAPESHLNSLMHVAAAFCSPEVIMALIAKGGNVDLVAELKVTPLMMAAKHNNAAMIECLIKANADVKKVDSSGNTVVHFAANNRKHHETVIPMLQQAGARIYKKNFQGRLPSNNTTITRMLSQLRTNYLTTFSSVLDYLAFNEKNAEMLYVAFRVALDKLIPKDVSHVSQLPLPIRKLFLAKYCAEITLNFAVLIELIADAYSGNVLQANFNEIIFKCLDAGMDVNGTDDVGCPLLFYAIKKNNKPLFNRLVTDTRININATDSNGNTALHIAVRDNNPEFVIRLVNNGADVNALNLHGQTPENCLVQNASITIRRQLSGEAQAYASNNHFANTSRRMLGGSELTARTELRS